MNNLSAFFFCLLVNSAFCCYQMARQTRAVAELSQRLSQCIRELQQRDVADRQTHFTRQLHYQQAHAQREMEEFIWEMRTATLPSWTLLRTEQKKYRQTDTYSNEQRNDVCLAFRTMDSQLYFVTRSHHAYICAYLFFLLHIFYVNTALWRTVEGKREEIIGGLSIYSLWQQSVGRLVVWLSCPWPTKYAFYVFIHIVCICTYTSIQCSEIYVPLH